MSFTFKHAFVFCLIPLSAAADSEQCLTMLTNNIQRDAASAILSYDDIQGDPTGLSLAIAAANVFATREGCDVADLAIKQSSSNCGDVQGAEICAVNSNVGYFLVHEAAVPDSILVFWARPD